MKRGRDVRADSECSAMGGEHCTGRVSPRARDVAGWRGGARRAALPRPEFDAALPRPHGAPHRVPAAPPHWTQALRRVKLGSSARRRAGVPSRAWHRAGPRPVASLPPLLTIRAQAAAPGGRRPAAAPSPEPRVPCRRQHDRREVRRRHFHGRREGAAAVPLLLHASVRRAVPGAADGSRRGAGARGAHLPQHAARGAVLLGGHGAGAGRRRRVQRARAPRRRGERATRVRRAAVRAHRIALLLAVLQRTVVRLELQLPRRRGRGAPPAAVRAHAAAPAAAARACAVGLRGRRVAEPLATPGEVFPAAHRAAGAAAARARLAVRRGARRRRRLGARGARAPAPRRGQVAPPAPRRRR